MPLIPRAAAWTWVKAIPNKQTVSMPSGLFNIVLSQIRKAELASIIIRLWIDEFERAGREPLRIVKRMSAGPGALRPRADGWCDWRVDVGKDRGAIERRQGAEFLETLPGQRPLRRRQQQHDLPPTEIGFEFEQNICPRAVDFGKAAQIEDDAGQVRSRGGFDGFRRYRKTARLAAPSPVRRRRRGRETPAPARCAICANARRRSDSCGGPPHAPQIEMLHRDHHDARRERHARYIAGPAKQQRARDHQRGGVDQNGERRAASVRRSRDWRCWRRY